MAGDNNYFWGSKNSEPKRKYTFQIHILGIPPFTCKTADKPKWTLGEAKVSYLNHDFKYPGRITWEDLKVTFYDPQNPDVTKALFEILKKAGYFYPDSPSQLQTVSKRRAVDATGDIRLSQLNHEGQVIETWVLKNAWFKTNNYGSYDYSSDDAMEIETTITYDWAELEGSTLVIPNGS